MKNYRKRMAAAFLIAVLLAGMLASCDTPDPGGGTDTTAHEEDGYFSDGDYRNAAGEKEDAVITLSGSTGTLSDTTRGSSGSTVTITAKGVYRVTGQSSGVQIVVDTGSKTGNVYIVLDGAYMENEGACIYVEDSDKTVIVVSGTSSLRSTSADDAAVYSKDDLTITGDGSLQIESGRNGVHCRNDLKITGATLNVTASYIGLKGGDSVGIDGGTVTLITGHDGIQVDSDDGTGFFVMKSGTVNITSEYDGIDVGSTESQTFTGYILISGGALSVTAGGGDTIPKSETSQKGLKCTGNILFDGGTVSVSSADDAVNSGTEVMFGGAAVTLSSSDDGVSASGKISFSGGELTVLKSYEGIEAADIVMNGGTVSITSSDDGINAAKNTLLFGSEGCTVNGGALYINSGGDGIDSNGSIFINGGTVIIEAAENLGNAPLDKGDSELCVLSISGGTVLALGSAKKAIPFDAGTQNSALLTVAGNEDDVISVSDGTGFTYTATKSFTALIYSSPALEDGNQYTVTYGNAQIEVDF